jgi:catechol 2,3-dioxygenase-like lactoylglutathione lyase family enzyme
VLTGIDHVVIVVPDLDAAIASYGDLGFTVVSGGRHPIGSHNALIGFADGAYLELIAFFEPTAMHRWRAMLDKGGGLVDFCMQTDDLAADAAAFRAAGVAMGEPWPLSGTRPDGYTLSWVLCTPGDPHGGLAPFLIEDTTPRDERVPKQRAHANGVTGIASLTVAAPDSKVVRRWWEAIPGARAGDVRRDDVGGAGARITVGSHALDFVAPTAPTSPLGAWISSRGPSPYALGLKTSGTTGALDERRAVNARLSLVR